MTSKTDGKRFTEEELKEYFNPNLINKPIPEIPEPQKKNNLLKIVLIISILILLLILIF